MIVDACVLVQAAVRDTLLRLFERRLFWRGGQTRLSTKRCAHFRTGSDEPSNKRTTWSVNYAHTSPTPGLSRVTANRRSVALAGDVPMHAVRQADSREAGCLTNNFTISSALPPAYAASLNQGMGALSGTRQSRSLPSRCGQILSGKTPPVASSGVSGSRNWPEGAADALLEFNPLDIQAKSTTMWLWIAWVQHLRLCLIQLGGR